MKYKGFLFDLDGTLIDTADMIIHCFNHTLNVFAGLKLPRHEIEQYIGRPLLDHLKVHLADYENIDYEAAMKEHLRFQLLCWRDFVTVFDGVDELLSTIKKAGVPMAIVTSRKSHTALLYTQELGIAKYFDLYVTPENTEHHKPHPEPALFAMEKLGLKKEETAFVGDSLFDMQCAVSSGVDGLYVEWGTGGQAPKDIPYKEKFSTIDKLIKYIS